ncbi:hypothetical protein [Frigoribacterium faeni]|uniref:DUF304 domain-containing protein n=2 Tax=Frigoribacterium faeni TaxID=145483 RepID=A0ABQ0UU41_9MICO|nr:hypothetical protein [Frigoribacterium faeni]BFF12995.1 hypothetical protein GCM10025699_42980 [Microbacterium flavescens]GEK83971.1 hypothetical protein FFA01_22800 [Frigoribacterium faeni]
MAMTAASVIAARSTGHGEVSFVLLLLELDLLWMTLLVTGLILRRRSEPVRAGWQRIARALPPAPVARAIGHEVAALRALAWVVQRRPPTVPVGALPVPAKSGTAVLPAAFVVASGVEITVLHLVLPYPALATALTALSVYGVVLLLGFVAVRWQHPHYLTETDLVIRTGRHVVATVPRKDIASARVHRDGTTTTPAVEGTTARIATLAGCNIAVTLSAPASVRLNASPRSTAHRVTELRFAADDTATVIDGLRRDHDR